MDQMKQIREYIDSAKDREERQNRKRECFAFLYSNPLPLSASQLDRLTKKEEF